MLSAGSSPKRRDRKRGPPFDAGRARDEQHVRLLALLRVRRERLAREREIGPCHAFAALAGDAAFEAPHGAPTIVRDRGDHAARREPSARVRAR